MKTLLIVAVNSELATNLSAALDPAQYRVVPRATVEEAEPLLAHGLADVCLVDVELRGVQDLWFLERLSKRRGQCPLIVCTGARQPEWEEQAYLQGASHVLNKPLSARSLEAIMERLPPKTAVPAPAPRPADAGDFPAAPVTPPPTVAPTLTLLRDFSTILTHSFNAEELLKQLLRLLRQIVAVNRAVIFLRPPPSGFGATGEHVDRLLHPVSALGLAPATLERAHLSLERGLGSVLERLGRIVRVNSEEVRADADAQRDFALLGLTAAVPIMDRESLIGVALFDGRVTGEPLMNAELEIIFHLLEQAGLAVRNIWLHAQQAAHHDLLTGVLRELSSACVVVDRDLRILHANKMARKYFGNPARPPAELAFADLPPALGTKVYQVLRTGAALSPFRFEPEQPAGAVYQVTMVPFQRDATGTPGSALLTIEDLTQSEQLRRLEMEASDLRMVKNMAHRLVAETGNAIVPLNTFVQIPPDAMDRNLLLSMLPALKDTDKRIERRVKQFRYLAEDVLELNDRLTLEPLLEKAFTEAQHYHPARNAQFVRENTSTTVTFPGNAERLTFALAEIFMNALQANATNPVLTVRRVEPVAHANGPMLAIEIHDNGPGFTAEAQEKVGKHFFTTRIPGLGLGLAVSRKIIAAHGGSLEIMAPGPAPHGIVRVLLPLAAAVPEKAQL